MVDPSSEPYEQVLSEQVASGDTSALNSLLSRHRDRLSKMVLVRLSPKLQARVDGSDVIQEAFLQAARSISTYEHDPGRPFYAWIRKITENKLLEVTRMHLGVDKRDAAREISLTPASASVSSASLAGILAANSLSGPLNQAIKQELQQLIHEELDSMDPTDREVIVLRHFEQLSLSEIASVLSISKSGAAKRYRLALQRLRDVMDRFPGLV